MSAVECARKWEAEALEDGRLRDADRESFERHAASCADCTAERTRLDALRTTMAALPDSGMAPLERHRLRGEILREANAIVTARRPTARRRIYVFLAFAAVASAATAMLLVVRWHHATPNATAISAPRVTTSGEPTFSVDAPNARLTKREGGPRTVMALDEGVAAFSVDHLGVDQRFLVALPDGEIEVRGTHFTVDVRDGITRRVAVSDGRVVLRRANAPDVLLLAKDVWAKDVWAKDVWQAESARAAEAAPPPSASSMSRPVSSAAAEFDSAMRRFTAGSYAEADERFATFERDFPHDPRSEDAAFLRAMSRSRNGDAAGAASLAASYLRAYPKGLRRTEAQRLVDADR